MSHIWDLFILCSSLVAQTVKRLPAVWFYPWVWKIPWRRKWQPTPVLLPGEFHGQRSLAATVHVVAKSWTQLSDWAHTNYLNEFPFFSLSLPFSPLCFNFSSSHFIAFKKHSLWFIFSQKVLRVLLNSFPSVEILGTVLSLAVNILLWWVLVFLF